MTPDEWDAKVWQRIHAAENTDSAYRKTDTITGPHRELYYDYGFPAWNAAEQDQISADHDEALREDVIR